MIAGRQADRQPLTALAPFGDAPARMLGDHSPAQQVAVLELPAGWRWQPAARRDHSWELFVLEGELGLDLQVLGRYDYAQLPSGASAPQVQAVTATRVLVFLDPPRSTDGEALRVVPHDEAAWRPGVVAERDTGIRLPLEVRDLLWVEATGQRTWLLRAGPELTLPWERHETVEEGFLVAGEYRLVECLLEGPQVHTYRPGGYFHRPPGIVHGGPDSGSDDTVVMLLRTPEALTVEFVTGPQPPC
jgi:hypothetical protein